MEYAATPRMMVEVASRMEATAHSGCGGCAKGKCPKSSKECKPASDCCVNCPMCYVTLLPVTIGHSGPVFVSVEYPAWASSYSFQYSISCWKPPNAA
jgi:hypothetical protein